jgi:hypothetical protein
MRHTVNEMCDTCEPVMTKLFGERRPKKIIVTEDKRTGNVTTVMRRDKPDSEKKE